MDAGARRIDTAVLGRGGVKMMAPRRHRDSQSSRSGVWDVEITGRRC